MILQNQPFHEEIKSILQCASELLKHPESAHLNQFAPVAQINPVRPA